MKQHPILNLAQPTPGDDQFYERWKEIGPVTSETPVPDPSRIEVLIVDQRIQVDSDFLRKFKSLKVVGSATTGHTHLRFDPEKEGVSLLTLRGETEFLSSIRSVAEFTLWGLLTLSLPSFKTGFGIRRLLAGKRLAVIGHGRIGKQVAHLARSFRMAVETWDREDYPGRIGYLFKTCDFISIHLSEEPGNEKIISKELIDSMKPTAYLINTARGSLVDEKALADALREDRLAGALVDVVGNSDLLNLSVPNLFLTEHTAGRTLEDRIRTDQFLVEKVKRFLQAPKKNSAPGL